MNLEIHCSVSREVAIAQRIVEYGDLAVRVTEEWMDERSEDELALLAQSGEGRRIGSFSLASHLDCTSVTGHALPELYAATPAGIAHWLQRALPILAERERHKAAEAAKREVKERAEAAQIIEEYRERAAIALAMGDDELVAETRRRDDGILQGPAWASDTVRRYRDEMMQDPQLAELRARMEAARGRANVLAEERRVAACEARERQEAEAKARYDAERLAWIAEHGSAHLRDLVELGFPFAATYRQEFVLHELGAYYEEYRSICGELVDIRDPSPDVIRGMKAERERLPGHDVELKWLRAGEHVSDGDNCQCGSRYSDDGFVSRAVLVVEVLGRDYVRQV